MAVETLDGKFEEAIAEVIVEMGPKKLPLLLVSHTIHMMTKASAEMNTYSISSLQLSSSSDGWEEGC